MATSSNFDWNSVPTAQPAQQPTGFDWDALPSVSSPQQSSFDWDSVPNQPEQGDDGWLASSWKFLNRPLYDFKKWGTRQGAGPLESGVEQGAEDLLSSFSSPLSLALTVGSLGMGPALRAAGIGLEELPVAIKTVKTLADMGFAAQNIMGMAKTSPRFLDALKVGDYQTAARLGTDMLGQGAAAIAGTRQVFESAPELADEAGIKTGLNETEEKVRDNPLGQMQLEKRLGTEHALKAYKQWNGDLKASAPDADAQGLGDIKGGIFRWLEHGGSETQLKSARALLEASKDVDPEYKEGALRQYDAALALTDQQKTIAESVKQHLDADWKTAYDHGMIRTAVENYQTHLWRDLADNEAANVNDFLAKNGDFSTNFNRAKQRTYAEALAGELQGKQLATTDPFALAANYHVEMARAMAARNFVDNLQELKAADGRPLAVLRGGGKVIEPEGESPAVLVNPAQVKNPFIPDEQVQAMMNDGSFQKLYDQGVIDKAGTRKDGTPIYAWDTGKYQSIDHPALRGWVYATPDPNGNPVFAKTDMVIHPDARQYVERAIGADKSYFRENQWLNAAMKLSGEAKHSLLSLSPFHVVQEGLRGVMTGLNPFKMGDYDLENDPKLQAGVKAGLTLGPDYRAWDDFTEGVGGRSKILEKIPLIGKWQAGLQDFLFNRYIPQLKARAFDSLYDRYRAAMPEASATDVAREAASHANDVFGGLNYQQLGRASASQDMARLVALAPDWLESEIRSLARAVNPEKGQIMRQDLGRIALYAWGTARVLNLITTGKLHLEAPFGVAAPSKSGEPETIYSLRTPLTDMIHAITDPRNFLYGRVNPLTVRTGIEALTGRDEYGRRVTGEQELANAAKNVIPIPVQAPFQTFTGSPVNMTNAQQVAKALGASPYKYQTEAEKAAMQGMIDQMPSGPESDASKQRSFRIRQVADKLRAKQMTVAQAWQTLPPDEAKQAVENSRLAPLQVEFKKLPLLQKLNVWDVATNPEKDELWQELWKARISYMQRHSPEERKSDPVWIRMQTVFPDLQVHSPASRERQLAPTHVFQNGEIVPLQ